MTSELTENIQYMKLLHELKATYPIVPDEFVKECISKHGADRNHCVDVLAKESDRLRTGSLNRRFSLQGRRSSVSSLAGNVGIGDSISSNGSIHPDHSITYHPVIPELQNDNHMSTIDLPKVVITPDSPLMALPPLFINNSPHSSDNDILILGRTSSVSAALFDFDPGSNPNDYDEAMLDNNNNHRNINNHNDNEVDNEVDVVNLNEDVENSSQSGQSMCSLSTATLSHGEVKVLGRNDLDEVVPLVTTSFTTLKCNSITVSPTEFPCVMERRQSTTSTYFYPPKSSSGSMNSHRLSNDCPENPFRKLFARRKEFYQTMSDTNKTGPSSSSASSSVNRMLLKKRHCTLCCSESRSCGSPAAPKPPKEAGLIKSNTEPIIPRLSPSSSRITLNAHIQPFAPFKISHDLGADFPAELTLDNSNVITGDSSPSDIVKILKDGSGGLELSADGQELRYATSAINSEDGMESHLEVSLGKDGGVITTRHKRLGSPSEISNNSVVQVHYDEDGGKILNIQHTQQKKTSRPNSLNLASLGNMKMAASEEPSNHHRHRSRPSSTYCGGNTFSALDHLLNNNSEKQVASSSFVAPLHNSLPNMYHHRPYPKLGGGKPDYGTATSLLYNSHPADEEKRLAFTRALLSHQMEQRLKLEQELRQRAEVLERVKGEVEELEYKLRQKEMIEHANHRSMVHSDYLPPSLLTSKPSYKESLRDIQNDVNNLQVICDKMAAEVTKLTKDKVPLGETSIEFYESLKNFGHSDTAPSSTGSNTNANVPDNGASAEGPQWSCSECTFLNHPALDHCEECEMPRIAIGRKPYVRQASKPCFCHETTTKSSKPSLSSISSSSSSKPQKSDGPESPKADSTTAEPPSLPHIEP